MEVSRTRPCAWSARFLNALRAGNGVMAAARYAGVSKSAVYKRRREVAAFRAAWDAIDVVDGRVVIDPEQRRPRGLRQVDRFLTELAATSNVTGAAAAAQVAVSQMYKLRREDPEFARRWYAALAEGYDNLEMELLGRLRAGDAAKDQAKFDTAAALRCLAAHRESVAREKGRRALAEEVTTIASINAKIDRLRLAGKAGAKAMAAARKGKAKQLRAGSNDAA